MNYLHICIFLLTDRFEERDNYQVCSSWTISSDHFWTVCHTGGACDCPCTSYWYFFIIMYLEVDFKTPLIAISLVYCFNKIVGFDFLALQVRFKCHPSGHLVINNADGVTKQQREFGRYETCYVSVDSEFVYVVKCFEEILVTLWFVVTRLNISDAVQVASTFREKKMPCDVIWMDIDYMDGFRCFTFDQV